MNSEHISYKTTKKYLKKLYTSAPWVVQGPGENAGIVDIGDGWCIALRIESHNHPTYINPFEGAATGVGGILRDIFTMGARPIAILDFLRFGTDEHSEELLKKTIDGISYYGNCVGVPNVGGDLYKDESYNKNPLVNVGCLGILRKEEIIYGNAKREDDLLIYVGSKTGNEGIGGAAMASQSFTNNIDMNRLQDNVQKSDPFLEKLLLEACCEIAKEGCVSGMQDMGAGGLLCASLEVVLRGREKTGENFGCNIYLDKVPTKYEMESCNILISESQERMLIVSPPENKEKIFEIFDKWELEYSVIGRINTSGEYKVYNGKEILYRENIMNFKDIKDDTYNASVDFGCRFTNSEVKVKEMERWRVYDSTVGNRTIKGPDKPGSYSIIDIYENSKKLYLTWGESMDECYNIMKQFDMVKPLCVVNCLNFGHPKDSITEFSYTINIMASACKRLNIPVVGGNVSLYNSTDGKSIRPTPILLMMGISM
jgi:phosphoribosylformylglycinamidine synthase